MPLLSPSEKSALELMLRNKLGSGAGTSVMLKLFDHVSESYVEPAPDMLTAKKVTTPEELDALKMDEPTPPVTTGEVAVEVTESSP